MTFEASKLHSKMLTLQFFLFSVDLMILHILPTPLWKSGSLFPKFTECWDLVQNITISLSIPSEFWPYSMNFHSFIDSWNTKDPLSFHCMIGVSCSKPHPRSLEKFFFSKFPRFSNFKNILHSSNFPVLRALSISL